VPVELAAGMRGVVRAGELGGLACAIGSAGARAAAIGSAGARAAAIARRLSGTTYLWGGTSSWGVDCSGLVQLAYAMSGIALPRDAKDQFRVTRPLAAEEEPEVGDLLFFGRDGDVNHVALVTVPPHFVHAYGRVEEATFAGGQRNGDGYRPELGRICLGIYRLALAKVRRPFQNRRVWHRNPDANAG